MAMPFILRLFVGLVLVVLAAAPAHAASTVLTKKDRAGDVTLYRPDFISTSQKKSIDIDRASVRALGNGKLRFTVRIKKVHKTRKWDQMVFFRSGFAGNPRQVEITFKIRGSAGAYAFDSATAQGCPLQVRRKGREASVDVPRRCGPTLGQSLTLDTYTGHYQTDAPPYSHDRLRLGTI